MNTQSKRRAVNPKHSRKPDGLVGNQGGMPRNDRPEYTDHEPRSTQPGPALKTKKTMRALLVGAAGVSILIGVLGYVGLVLPMEKKLITDQLHRLVREIGVVIETRSAVMGAATHNLRERDLHSMEPSEQIYHSLRSRFSDLQRLEVIDGDGEILGMVGDLPVSKSGLEMRTQVSSFAGLKSQMHGAEEHFQDHQESGCFFITRKLAHGARGDMFIRAKFSRRPINRILASASQDSNREAHLARVSGRQPGIEGEISGVRIDGNWLTGPIAAEIVLSKKGWAVIMKGGPGVGRYLPIGLSLVGLIALGLLPARRFIGRARAAAQVAEDSHAHGITDSQEEGLVDSQSASPMRQSPRVISEDHDHTEISSDLEEFLEGIPWAEVLNNNDRSSDPGPSTDPGEKGLITSHSDPSLADQANSSFATAALPVPEP